MPTLTELITEMVDDPPVSPYGTLVMSEFSLQIWWSPGLWNSPKDGREAQPEKWLCLGSSSWWGGPEQKRIFQRVREIAGDLFPQWPGEDCELREIQNTHSIDTIH